MSNLYEYIKMAVHNIMANKGRSFLTMLGIIIGIASVIDTPCPALAEAIYNATGVRLTELPMTPEKIAMEILKNRESTRSGTKVEE